MIDFSVYQAAPTIYAAAAKAGVALVSGTTNLDEKGQKALDAATEKVAVVWSSNMSRGVQILAEVVQYAMRKLGAEFDVEMRDHVELIIGALGRIADDLELG